MNVKETKEGNDYKENKWFGIEIRGGNNLGVEMLLNEVATQSKSINLNQPLFIERSLAVHLNGLIFVINFFSPSLSLSSFLSDVRSFRLRPFPSVFSSSLY